MMTTLTKMIAATAIAFLAIPSARAGTGRDLGAWASKAALRAGVTRVAVLPFSPLDGSSDSEGVGIAEELAVELARRGKVSVLERGMLPAVLSEHRLGMTGLLRQGDLAALGAFPQAQAVVLGSFVTLGNAIQVNARLVLVATGESVAARRVEGRREGAFDEVIARPAPITADEAVKDVFEFQTGRRYQPRPKRAPPAAGAQTSRRPASGDLRDAPADPCSGAGDRVNSLQEDILEIKARYWAAQARRKGFSVKAVRVKPSATIPDRGLRERFLELMSECPADDAPLTLAEVRRFVSADRQSFELLASCALERN